MPTKFQKSWLQILDKNGMKAGVYLEETNDEFTARCNICESPISIKSAFCRVENHSGTQIHRSMLTAKSTQLKLQFQVNNNSPTFSASNSEQTGESSTSCDNSQTADSNTSSRNLNINSQNKSKEINNNNTTLTLFNPRTAAARAELFLCLDIIVIKQSFLSCNNKKDLYLVVS